MESRFSLPLSFLIFSLSQCYSRWCGRNQSRLPLSLRNNRSSTYTTRPHSTRSRKRERDQEGVSNMIFSRKKCSFNKILSVVSSYPHKLKGFCRFKSPQKKKKNRFIPIFFIQVVSKETIDGSGTLWRYFRPKLTHGSARFERFGTILYARKKLENEICCLQFFLSLISIQIHRKRNFSYLLLTTSE